MFKKSVCKRKGHVFNHSYVEASGMDTLWYWKKCERCGYSTYDVKPIPNDDLTDLEKIKQFYNWLGAKYEIEESEDIKNVEGGDCNLRLTVGEDGAWYWAVYLFKDEKLVNWYLTE